MPSMVVSLTVTGDRVFAGDQMESCHCFKYRKAENQLVEFADDQVKLKFGSSYKVVVCVCRSVIHVLHRYKGDRFKGVNDHAWAGSNYLVFSRFLCLYQWVTGGCAGFRL